MVIKIEHYYQENLMESKISFQYYVLRGDDSVDDYGRCDLRQGVHHDHQDDQLLLLAV